MEKTITKLAIMMAMFMSVTIVVSCGGDDEETGGGGISDGGNNNPISTKHLVRKTWSGHSDRGDESGTDVYIYDSNGRIKMRKKEENSSRPKICQYIYEDNKIVCERDYYGRCTYTYTLSNGRIVKEVEEESDGVYSYTYAYNDNGYLISIACESYYYYDDESYRGEYLLSWSNGNLINIIHRYYRGTDLEEEYTYNYEYTNIPWPKNWIHDNHTEATNIDDVLLYSGLFGKTPKNLPSKLKKDNETFTFDYVVENGVVTKFLEDYHTSDYTEIGNLVYNIYWE